MPPWHVPSPVASPAALQAPRLVLKVAAVVGEVGPLVRCRASFLLKLGHSGRLWVERELLLISEIKQTFLSCLIFLG